MNWIRANDYACTGAPVCSSNLRPDFCGEGVHSLDAPEFYPAGAMWRFESCFQPTVTIVGPRLVARLFH